MDSCGKRVLILIDSAHDDAFMLGTLPVQSDEIFAIVRYDDAAFANGDIEIVRIAHRLTSFARLLNRKDIVTEAAQF